MTTKNKKSAVSLSKHSSRSITLMRKDRSSIITRDKRSSITVTTFDAVLKQYWMKYCAIPFLRVNIVPNEPQSGDFSKFSTRSQVNLKDSFTPKAKVKKPVITGKSPELMMTYDNYEFQVGLNTVAFKHLSVNRCMLVALRSTLQKFDTLKVLKLDFCNLQNTDIRMLKNILHQSDYIQTLSINGNPNIYQNFYLLIKNTRLSQICLRFCQINDRGVELIARQLRTYEHPLLFLDLSSNFISDTGVNSICDALRINRSLLSLNLADNWITDVGCIAIISILQKFPLVHEECVIRRRRIIQQYRERINEVEAQKAKLLASSISKKSNQDFVKPKEKSIKGHPPIPPPIVKKEPTINRKQLEKIVMQVVDSIIQNDKHPFVKDSYVENQELMCKGNLVLLNLNMSYNKITSKACQKIIEMLMYQQEIGKGNVGLTNILLEGNQAQEDCTEINYINCLKQDIQNLHFSSGSVHSKSSNKKRRSSVCRTHSANI